MSTLFTQCPSDTVQTKTGKVDPARKFKCTTAARGKWILKLKPTEPLVYRVKGIIFILLGRQGEAECIELNSLYQVRLKQRTAFVQQTLIF